MPELARQRRSGRGVSAGAPARRRSALFEIGGSIPGRRKAVYGLIAFVVLFAVWWAVTAAGLVQPVILPGPGAVFAQLGDAISSGQLWGDAGVSLYRILLGFLIATVLALPIGILAGCYPLGAAVIEPLMDFVRYMPVVAFVPLSIVWVGLGNSQKFLIIFIGTFFQQVLMFADTIKRVPLEYVSIARTLGMKDPRILARVMLPAAAPGLWDSMRITLGWAWTWVVLAELVAATSGLGYRITTAQRYFQTDLIIAYILVLGLLGLITDQTMRFAGRRAFRYLEVRR